MKPPCMLMVGSILPALRVMLARRMVEEYGLTRSEVARRLQVSRAAVTQYLKGVRGNYPLDLIAGSEAGREALERLTLELSKENPNFVEGLRRLCAVCRILRRERKFCDWCEKMMPAIQGMGCDACEPRYYDLV